MIQLCENSCFCEEIESSRQEAQPSDSHHGPVKMETRATRGGLQCLRKDKEHEEAEGQRGGRGRISSNIRLRVIRVMEAEGSQYKKRSLCNKLSNDNSKVCSAVHWSDILYCLYCMVKVFCAPHYVYIQSSVTETGQVLFMSDLYVLQKWGDFGKKTFHRLLDLKVQIYQWALRIKHTF